jgi:hypothetical protein
VPSLPSVTRRTIKTVKFDDLKRCPDKVAALACRPGGVSVVDEHGIERFRLWIPSTRLKG